jgi:hypothetical protein
VHVKSDRDRVESPQLAAARGRHFTGRRKKFRENVQLRFCPTNYEWGEKIFSDTLLLANTCAVFSVLNFCLLKFNKTVQLF